MANILLLPTQVHGHFEHHDPDLARPIAGDVLRCCHCQRIFTVERGMFMGKCYKCNDYHCGPGCKFPMKCVPVEQWLENVEKGRPEDYTPIVSRSVEIPTRTVGTESFGEDIVRVDFNE